MRGGRRNEKVKTQAKSQIQRLRDTEIKKDTEMATNKDRPTMKQWNRVRDRKADRLIETRVETDNFIQRKGWMNKWWFFGFVFSVIDVFGDDTTQWFSYCSCRQQFHILAAIYHHQVKKRNGCSEDDPMLYAYRGWKHAWMRVCRRFGMIFSWYACICGVVKFKTTLRLQK